MSLKRKYKSGASKRAKKKLRYPHNVVALTPINLTLKNINE